MNKIMMIAGATVLAAFAVAQEAPFGPAMGVKTLSVSGSFTEQKAGVTVRTTTLDLSASYFLTNTFEGRFGLRYNNIDSTVDTTSDSLFLGVRYYFQGERELTPETIIQPFVGIMFDTTKVTGQDRANGFGAELGLHYFLQPNVAVTPAISFTRARVGGEDFDTTGLAFGLTVFFK